MVQLNFPAYRFEIKNRENKPYILDRIRKKWVVLQPEEWVRQHCVAFLIETKKYPQSLINVEKKLMLNGKTKRYDVIVYSKQGTPQILIECKAPSVPITQESFDQIARYNMVLNSPYLMVTNGQDHFYCQISTEKAAYQFLKELPNYNPIS